MRRKTRPICWTLALGAMLAASAASAELRVAVRLSDGWAPAPAGP